MNDWGTLAVFAICYALFAALPARRPWVAMTGAVATVMTGALSWRSAILEAVNWNVMGLFWGTLVLADLFMHSRVPAVLAERLVDRTRTARAAMLVLCALSGALSIFLENVAVVLLVAPVALSVADKLRISPVRLLVAIAVSSNLQGTATMIGDPPSMIVAGYLHMGFLDFFVYHGRPGIFFAVQAGAAVSMLVLAWLFRSHGEAPSTIPVETVRSWFPSLLLGLLVAGLSVATLVDPDFRWFAGVHSMVLAVAALLWMRRCARWMTMRSFLGSLDWGTTFFLMGVFVIVAGLSGSDWLDRAAEAILGASGASLFAIYAMLVLLAAVCSAFVDNVPFILAMLPVTRSIAAHLVAPETQTLLVFGLLIGTCLGGNLSPLGASANVVAIGLLKKRGYQVGFPHFMRVGVPFTLAALTAGAVFVWIVWSP